MKDHVIEQLSKERIPEAKALVDLVFPHQNPGERASFPMISGEAKLHQRLLFAIPGIRLLDFWVAISPDDEVHGIVGLYSMRKDRSDALWLGWFAVHPEARGKGLGGTLLRKAIEEARERDVKYLRLYTSDTDLIQGGDVAQEVYERYGLVEKSRKHVVGGVSITKEKGLEVIRFNNIIRELKLQ